MTLFPEHAYKATSFNQMSMYASYAEHLGRNIPLEIQRGENFIWADSRFVGREIEQNWCR